MYHHQQKSLSCLPGLKLTMEDNVLFDQFSMTFELLPLEKQNEDGTIAKKNNSAVLDHQFSETAMGHGKTSKKKRKKVFSKLFKNEDGKIKATVKDINPGSKQEKINSKNEVVDIDKSDNKVQKRPKSKSEGNESEDSPIKPVEEKPNWVLGKYICNFCEKDFGYRRAIYFHMKSKHNIIWKASDHGLDNRVSKCWTKGELGKYVCEACEKDCGNKINLRYHMKNKHESIWKAGQINKKRTI